MGGLVALLDAAPGDELAEPINLGSPDEITIADFAQLIIDRTGSTSSIELRELPTDDPKIRRPDITRANELLGWWPAVGLVDGLDRTVHAFRRS